MFIMVLIMMATAYVEKSKFGIIFELTYVYYPLFRGLILATVFVALYGFDVYVWKHSGVDYHTLLDVHRSPPGSANIRTPSCNAMLIGVGEALLPRRRTPLVRSDDGELCR